jgi:glycosyltransferase involved in cell wall biosynthesis
MNLVFIVKDLYPYGGGTGVYYEQISRQFARSGHRVWLISAIVKNSEDYQEDGVQYIHVPADRAPIPFTSLLLWDWRVARVIRDIEARYGVDIVEFPSYFPEGLVYAYMPRKAAVSFRLYEWKSPMTVGRLFYDFRTMLREIPCWLQMARGDALIAESDTIRDTYLRFMGEKRSSQKMYRHYLGVDMKIFSQTPDKPDLYRSLEGKRIILFVGRITDFKGAYNLIDAFRNRIADRFPDTSLVLLGQPEDPEKFNRVMAENTDGRLIHVAHIEQHELSSYYSHAYVFAGPSTNEPLGLVFVEALACGLPVISVAKGGPLEIVEDEKTGILCPDNSPGAIATALERLLSDRELRDQMAASGRASVVGRFGYDVVMSELLVTYRTIIGTRNV